MSSEMYVMESLEDGVARHLQGLEFLVLASGSDKRAYAVLSQVLEANNNPPAVVLAHFKERLAGKSVGDPIYDFKNLNIPILHELVCDIHEPNSSLEGFSSVGLGPKSTVGVDISCFTKPYFFYLLRLLVARFQYPNLRIFYTEPKSYRFPTGLFESFHTSTGPIRVIELDGYQGKESRNSTRQLIVLLGFDGDLLQEINESVSPNETIAVNGFPAYSQKFKDISLIANEKLVGDSNVKTMYARANNPFDVYNLLKRIKDASGPEVFLNIAPLGTKPMALGACLFALHNPEVRIVYPLPEDYDDSYSDQAWHSWMYSLPLTK